jgi:hypothetical protein
MSAPAQILELIGVFERHADEYASSDCKEESPRCSGRCAGLH